MDIVIMDPKRIFKQLWLADVEDWDLVVNVNLGQNDFKVYQKKKNSTLM